jgi:hypothetical protein
MVGLQTLDLAIGVRVPASQPKKFKHYGRLAMEQRTDTPNAMLLILSVQPNTHTLRSSFVCLPSSMKSGTL